MRRPKLAASLILTRARRHGGPEILFGRRSGDHVFMPRKYVFPGGRVDRADSYAPLASEPGEVVFDVMGRVLPAARIRAAAAAAVRETAEETGLLIARPAPVATSAPSWRPFTEAGLAPSAAPLSVIARAITPPGRPRRYDTWFFASDIEAVHDAASLAGSGELEDLRWARLDEAHTLDIPVITRFVLSELKAHLTGPAPVRCARVTRAGPVVETI